MFMLSSGLPFFSLFTDVLLAITIFLDLPCVFCIEITSGYIVLSDVVLHFILVSKKHWGPIEFPNCIDFSALGLDSHLDTPS